MLKELPANYYKQNILNCLKLQARTGPSDWPPVNFHHHTKYSQECCQTTYLTVVIQVSLENVSASWNSVFILEFKLYSMTKNLNNIQWLLVCLPANLEYALGVMFWWQNAVYLFRLSSHSWPSFPQDLFFFFLVSLSLSLQRVDNFREITGKKSKEFTRFNAEVAILLLTCHPPMLVLLMRSATGRLSWCWLWGNCHEGELKLAEKWPSEVDSLTLL